MGIRNLTLTFMLATLSPPPPNSAEPQAQSVVVLLHNGDRISGQWFYQKPGVDIYLKTAWGDLAINRYAVKKITLPTGSVIPAPN